MKQLIYVLLLCSITFSGVKAQNSGEIINRLSETSEKGGKIQVQQSETFVNAFDKYLQVQKKSNQTNGFRICIFADSGQEAKRNAENARSKFLSQYNDINVYTVFKNPSWYRVYVGDFRTKSETLKYLKLIERDFIGAYSVPENIYFF